MRDYAIMVREREGREPVFATVPYGFSWLAFLFQPLWALCVGAWATALVLLVVGLLMPWAGAAAGLSQAQAIALDVAAALAMAFLAQDLRRFELSRRGFRLVDIVAARSLGEAEARGIDDFVDDRMGRNRIIGKQGLPAGADRSI